MGIILTGLRIQERHNLILPVIGVFTQEDEAFLLVIRLSWVLPLALIVFSLVDVLLIWSYIKFFHPWREILQFEEPDIDVKETKGEEKEEETEEAGGGEH